MMIGYEVHRATELGTYLVVRTCSWCRQESTVEVDAQGLWDWEHGMCVQDAFPHLSRAVREQLVNGTHPACWDEMFAGFGDEDDDDEEGEEVT